MDVYELKKKVFVSVQAAFDEPLYEEVALNAMMKSVVNGGAQGLRVAGARDIKNAKTLFDLPVIGITKPKKLPENWLDVVYITPTLEDIKMVIDAGADVVAFDGTLRQRTYDIKDAVELIHSAGKLAMADIATLQDGLICAQNKCDIISTTLSGYTSESLSDNKGPDFELLDNLVEKTNVPIILEGRIQKPEEVKMAFEKNAWAVVIGSAITRPQLITKNFISWERL